MHPEQAKLLETLRARVRLTSDHQARFSELLSKRVKSARWCRSDLVLCLRARVPQTRSARVRFVAGLGHLARHRWANTITDLDF